MKTKSVETVRRDYCPKRVQQIHSQFPEVVNVFLCLYSKLCYAHVVIIPSRNSTTPIQHDLELLLS